MDPDQVRVRHMLDAARDALLFVAGKSRLDLDHDRMLALALMQSLQIIGEAAARISETYRAQFSEVPWGELIGMRNRLVHAYYDINLDVVWNTVTADLPALVASLEKIVRGHTE